MDSHPYPAVSRHPPILPWDAEKTPTSHSGVANKRDGIQQAPAGDSFFTRVFGHHHPSSQDHSRANSPSTLLAAPSPQHTLSSTTRSTSRHSRNSSAGHIVAPTHPIPFTNNAPFAVPMQRRKSLSNHSDPYLRTDSLPSSRATSPMPRAHHDTSHWQNGKRTSEHGALPSSSSSSSSVSGRQRSNSGYDELDPIPHSQAPPTKNRKGFFGRFGKKKSQNNLHASFSTQSLASPVPSSAASVTQSNSSIISNYRENYTHPLDYESLRFDAKPFHSKISDRKRSAGSSASASGSRKGSALHEEFTRKMDIEYAAADTSYILSENPDDLIERWTAPDSWAVDPPFMDSSAPIDEHSEGDLEQEKWDIKKKSYCIRIFRPDATFATLQVPLNSTTSELMDKLAAKFFETKNKFELVLGRRNLERVLGPDEHPLQLQKLLLEQMGYAEEDKIEDVGREDNSYLLRFIFRPANSHSPIEPTEFGTNVDLQGWNLLAIPPPLYEDAFKIEVLDASRNMLMKIPLDFLNRCKKLHTLKLENNYYRVKDFSGTLSELKTLERLHLSSNRFDNLSPVRPEVHIILKELEAYNNHLVSLPMSFVQLKYLTSLIISNNFFTSFPEVICQITSLKNLDISFNKIKAFPDTIGNLISLESLYAISNEISGPLHQSFGKLRNLAKLDIRQNYIESIDVLSSLSRLEVLLIDYNTVERVEREFSVPIQLKKFSMYKHGLAQFNPGALTGFASNMTELNLSHGKFSSLPDDIFLNMPFLEHIDLNVNQLTTIPSSIKVLAKLVDLHVQGNRLESLPPGIAQLKDLKVLDVQKNNLKTLPKEIWLCASLQTLNCSSNLLESFPEPYTEPGAGHQLPLAPRAEAMGIPSMMTSASVDPTAQIQLNANAGQGVVPDNQMQIKPLQRSDTGSLSGISPNFNPPSFFASPQNHPPPLSLSLRYLFLGDNRLTDDVWAPISLFLELRTLNLVFNDLYEVPSGGLCHSHLYELYLSGNQLTSLPADDIEKLSYLRVLAVNGNKLQTLPAEIGKLRKLLVLDVGNNVLKYNIANWPYDWNWNWNLGLRYLNLSGNKRLEIKKSHPEPTMTKEKDLSDFSALTRLRMLGLMDVTILVSLPDESVDRRVRTSPSEVNNMAYGIADWMGPNEHLATWDLVMPKFRNSEEECVFGLFDGPKRPKSGCKLTKYLNDSLTQRFTDELRKNENEDSIVAAMRRAFLMLEKDLGSLTRDEKHPDAPEAKSGASAVVCYVSGTKLYVANVGNALAVISRNGGKATEIAQKHIPLNPAEISRIREAGGYVSNQGLLNGELDVSRGFGYFHLIPVVNANPYVSTHNLTENDEFVIMASRGLWDCMSYQTAVDIARTEKDDLMLAAQKLRDFAITYGAEDNLMVMVVGVSDLFGKRNLRRQGGVGAVGPGRGVGPDGSGLTDDTTLQVNKLKRRGKEEGPGDSTLARLEREVEPPINYVALVFTDIKSSTQFWETQPDNMRSAIKIHDEIMRRQLRRVGGYEVKTEGDAFMVCFQHITSALLWCFQVQIDLLEADWPAGILETEEGREIERNKVTIYKGLSVRMGIHWGSPVLERNPVTNRMDYFGPVVNKAGRISNEADGGQICVSSDVIAALRNFPGVIGDNNMSLPMDDSLVSKVAPYAISGGGASLEMKSIQQLKRLGFHVMELGERRLKGLETPEMLSFVFPKQLAGRMELEKRDMIPNAVLKPTNPAEFISPAQSPPLGPDLDKETLDVPPSTEPIKRTIDPVLVSALSNLAIRLERLTAGNPLMYDEAGSSINNAYTMKGTNDNPTAIISAASSGIGRLLDKHIKEEASDQELTVLMENCVARVENAASSLYLQKVGHFANVLDKLGEAIELDPMHIMRALQMYSEVAGHTTSPSTMPFL